MPGGIPVATVALDGAKNAGILAAEILALSDSQIRNELISMRKKQTEKVLNDVKQLERQKEV